MLSKRLLDQIDIGRIVLNQQEPVWSGPAHCPAFFSGMVKKHVDPCPAWDSAQIRPPRCSTALLQIARPLPAPAYFAPCKRLNIPQILFNYCGSMPMPLSCTESSPPPQGASPAAPLAADTS